MTGISRRSFSGIAIGAMAAPSLLRAQSALPSGVITIVAPFPAGGSSDAKARIIAEKLSQATGRQFIVENQAGGGGRLAARQVKAAPPDGTKILLANTSVMVLTPMQPEAGYDPLEDFVAIGGGSEFAAGLATGPMTGAKTLAELGAWLKANPSQASYGIPASGSLPHLAGITYGQAIGLELTAVPYRGGAPMVQDLLAGKLAIGIAAAADFAAQHQAGQLRLVGVSGTARAPGLPDVPTFGEAGIKGLEINAWNAFFMPKGTAPALVSELNREINAVLAQPDVKSRLGTFAFVASPSKPEEPMAWIKRDQAAFRPLLVAAGIIK